MACQRKLPQTQLFSPSLNLNDAHAILHRTVLLQSAQFENENGKDDYRHKFTDGRKGKIKRNQSKEGKKHFSPQMKLNCVCFIIAFLCFYCYEDICFFLFGGFPSLMKQKNCFRHHKFSIYDKKA